MKKLFSVLVAALLVVSMLPFVAAVDVGVGIGVDIETEDFEPIVWMCDSRIVSDDNVEYGRVSPGGENLVERIQNYAFEGEQISWKVLVFDKNGIEKVSDVYVTIGDTQGDGNDIEANCALAHVLPAEETIDPKCNARILEEELDNVGYENVAAYYDCTLTVETPNSMYGEYWVTVEAVDLDGLTGTFDENEYWFFNPVIALSIDGEIAFEEVRPGTASYSDTMLIGNDADEGSGVMLDMFIAGTDFYDPASSGAKCPTTNQLSLDAFSYFATHGAYSTTGDDLHDNAEYDPFTVRANDAEGYVNIQYGDHWDKTAYYEAEILQDQLVGPAFAGGYYTANILSPGSEMALTFRLMLPEPCNGDFSEGSIYIFGEAI